MVDFTRREVVPGGLAAVQAAGALERSLFVTGNVEALRLLRGLSAEARIGLTWVEGAAPPLPLLEELRAEYWNPMFGLVTPEGVAAVHAAGLQVSTWTVDDPRDMSPHGRRRGRRRREQPGGGAGRVRAVVKPGVRILRYDPRPMGTATNGKIEIHFESFGDPGQPTLLLVNGLGSQCINYAAEWCQMFCDEGFQVVRFDNRDVGLSTKLHDAGYALADMADDAVAVLDALGVDTAHVMGCSMGGMIVQRLAIDHPDRLLSVTSVMSRTGEPGSGDSSADALAFLMAPPPSSRVGLRGAPGGRLAGVRIEARVARRDRHPRPRRRRLRPLLLPGGDRPADAGRHGGRIPGRTAARPSTCRCS